MTSFLNKKFSLILVILATLIIATSISSVAADWQTQGITTTAPADVKLGDNVTVSVDFQSNVAAGEWADGTYSLEYSTDGGTTWNPLTSTVSGPLYGHVDNSIWYPTTLTFNTADINVLGPVDIKAVYIPNAADAGYGFTGFDFDTTDTGFNPSGGDYVVSIFITADAKVMNATNATDIKFGQEGNYTGILMGFNTTSGLYDIPLPGVTFDYFLNGVLVSSDTTDADGAFNVNFGLLTNFTSILRLEFDMAGAGYPEYPDDFEQNFTLNVGLGKIVEDVFVNSTAGFYLGDNATVTWTLDPDTLTAMAGKNILAWIVLSNPNDGTEWRKIMVDLTTKSLDLSSFIKTHETLRVSLFINGLDLTSLTQFFQSGEAGYVDTFVYTNDSIPVQITDVTPNGTVHQVGKESTMTFLVESKLGVAANGILTVTFDGIYDFNVTVTNGTADFTHIYTQAGENRYVTTKFLGDADQNINPSVKGTEKTVNITKGNASVILTQSPNMLAAFIGETVTFDILIDNFYLAANAAPKSITIVFTDAGKVVNELVVDIVAGTVDTNATATITYSYVLTHAPVIVIAKLVDDKGNYITSESNKLTVVVV
ncbi:MAG: hypothetical protein FWH54_02995 [Methanobrevibacter sp.]|nr:hypothetical protein [Methanobrevibacter sp.]